MSTHTKAVLQAFFVTFLWSSSWVIIKIALEDLSPLTFAGLRFLIAFLFLIPFCLRKESLIQIKEISWPAWVEIILLGILYYTITPGGQNLGLKYLPANTLSLILSFTAVFVAFMGIYLLKEKPTFFQWLGLCVFLLGVIVYFWQQGQQKFSWIGILIGSITMLTNSFSTLLGRKINKNGTLSPLLVTTLSMGIGTILLLTIGISFEGLPKLSTRNWGFTIWLAIINTALAYQLWNKTMRVLPALESTLINNSMLIQISILAWFFLEESLSPFQIIGLVIATVGVIMVQIFSTKNNPINQ